MRLLREENEETDLECQDVDHAFIREWDAEYSEDVGWGYDARVLVQQAEEERGGSHCDVV